MSGIVYLRNKLSTELEQKQAALAEIQPQIPVAIEEGEDEAALVLIQKKDELNTAISQIQAELEKVSGATHLLQLGLDLADGRVEFVFLLDEDQGRLVFPFLDGDGDLWLNLGEGCLLLLQLSRELVPQVDNATHRLLEFANSRRR